MGACLEAGRWAGELQGKAVNAPTGQHPHETPPARSAVSTDFKLSKESCVSVLSLMALHRLQNSLLASLSCWKE